MRWDEFMTACPELAELGEARFRADEVCLVGTLRQDGSPRISPVEPEFAEGHLMLGMMWQSKKALDLLRDPRCTVHSIVKDRHGTDGDFKIFGKAIDIQDPHLRKATADAIYARIGWSPEGGDWHLFSVDIESAAFIRFGDESQLLTWNPRDGLKHGAMPES